MNDKLKKKDRNNCNNNSCYSNSSNNSCYSNSNNNSRYNNNSNNNKMLDWLGWELLEHWLILAMMEI